MTMRPLHFILAGTAFLATSYMAVAQTLPAAMRNNAVDSTFMRSAQSDGLAEIQRAQLALQKSSNAQVKQLAQRIVDQQTKANQQLGTMAGSRNVTLPTVPGVDARKQNKAMQAKKGDAFDQSWSNAVVKDQQNAVKLFTQENRQTSDADLRQFTKSALPGLETHLKQAQQLAAVPDERDKAMDQTMKSMVASPDSTAAPTAVAPMPIPAAPVTPPTARH